MRCPVVGTAFAVRDWNATLDILKNREDELSTEGSSSDFDDEDNDDSEDNDDDDGSEYGSI